MSEQPMRAYIVEFSPKGGLVHYSYQLARALQNAGIDTKLVTARQYELDDLEHNFEVVKLLNLWDPREQTSPIHRKIRRGLRAVRYIGQWLKLLRYLHQEKPDFVILGDIRFAFEQHFLRLLHASRFRLVDIVHNVQSFNTNEQSSAILESSEKQRQRYEKLYSLFDALFVHNKSNRELFLSCYQIAPSRVHAIPHATSQIMLDIAPDCTPDELRQQWQIPADRPVILFFGTITKYKGVEDLIEAFPAVLHEVDAQLVIAGYPSKDMNAAALQARSQKLDISDHVTWYLDYVPNEIVAPLLQLSQVVVLPYRAISQSGILQIAYAFGRPVIATRVGGLPDVVEDGESGLLVEPGNQDQLTQAMIQILKNPEQSAQMGQRASWLAENVYSWDSVARKMKCVFEELIEQAAP